MKADEFFHTVNLTLKKAVEICEILALYFVSFGTSPNLRGHKHFLKE